MNRFLTLALLLLMPLCLESYPGEVIKSFDSPNSFPTGLAYDGENLCLADRQTDKIYFINPESGEVVREIESPAYWTTGLAWDGENLWCADIKGGLPLSENYDGKIYKINPKTGKVLKTISAPGSSPRDLAWDGEYLWCVDNRLKKVIQFSPNDGTTIISFHSPANDPRGLAYDGKYLWVSDRKKDEIYMICVGSGEVMIITDAPGKFAKGLCFDGNNVWNVDDQSDKIFKLKVRDGEKYRKSDKRRARVRYIHQTTNYGPGTLTNLDAHIALPKERDNQTLLNDIGFTPKYDEIKTDKWGQKTAYYNVKDLEAGKRFEAQTVVEVETFDVRYFIYPEEVGTLDEIPAEIKSKYLENNEKYQINHPIIRDAVKEAVGDFKNPYKIARKIFMYLIKNMYYEMVGGWNTAPAVLERGNGSCSEYAFVYISMCRAAGLPARYVGSVVVRGDDASMDDVFHRWAEVYIPNYGWIPIDPSGGDKELPRDRANYIGHVANRYLITTQSGGGSDTMEWTYNSNEFWQSEPKAFIVVDNFADWEPLDK